MSSRHTHYCYQCMTQVQLRGGGDHITCSNCGGGFVQQLNEDGHQTPALPSLVRQRLASRTTASSGERGAHEDLLQELTTNRSEGPERSPASMSSINAMQTINITQVHLQADSQCPICIESFELGSLVHQMPCSHIYHSACIIPWLLRHNSCPICRHQLPQHEFVTLSARPRYQISSDRRTPFVLGPSLDTSGSRTTRAESNSDSRTPFELDHSLDTSGSRTTRTESNSDRRTPFELGPSLHTSGSRTTNIESSSDRRIPPVFGPSPHTSRSHTTITTDSTSDRRYSFVFGPSLHTSGSHTTHTESSTGRMPPFVVGPENGGNQSGNNVPESRSSRDGVLFNGSHNNNWEQQRRRDDFSWQSSRNHEMNYSGWPFDY